MINRRLFFWHFAGFHAYLALESVGQTCPWPTGRIPVGHGQVNSHLGSKLARWGLLWWLINAVGIFSSHRATVLAGWPSGSHLDG